MSTAAIVASFKLRFFDVHARIVLASGETGVDLRGDDARAAFAAAAPLMDAVRALTPDARVRSLSMDLATARVLVTLDVAAGAHANAPRVLRVDPPKSDALVDAAADVLALLAASAAEKLAARP